MFEIHHDHAWQVYATPRGYGHNRQYVLRVGAIRCGPEDVSKSCTGPHSPYLRGDIYWPTLSIYCGHMLAHNLHRFEAIPSRHLHMLAVFSATVPWKHPLHLVTKPQEWSLFVLIGRLVSCRDRNISFKIKFAIHRDPTLFGNLGLRCRQVFATPIGPGTSGANMF